MVGVKRRATSHIKKKLPAVKFRKLESRREQEEEKKSVQNIASEEDEVEIKDSDVETRDSDSSSRAEEESSSESQSESSDEGSDDASEGDSDGESQGSSADSQESPQDILGDEDDASSKSDVLDSDEDDSVSAGMGYDDQDAQQGELSDEEEDDEAELEAAGASSGMTDAANLTEQEIFENLPHDREVLKDMLDRLLELLRKGNGDTKKTKRGHSRKLLLNQLIAVICKYYGYNKDLATYFIDLFGPEKGGAFFEANDAPRPLTIRTNVLKTRRRDLAQTLISRGANVDPIGEWCKAGLIVKDSTIPIGATPEYLAGHYMLQAASSFLPVIALDPQPDEKIMDMAAAPGGKSTFIAQMMRNTGVLYANDANKTRAFALTANLHRMGVRNCVVTHMDGRKTTSFVTKLDRVLLDAPCTGSGVIAKDASIKLKRTPLDFEKQAGLQRELLSTAVELVDANSKRGGIIVYSTCSVSVEENEAVVNYILKTKKVKLIDTGISFGTPGLTRYRKSRFHPSLTLTRRFYPHTNNMDGFFVAKLQKLP